MKIDKFIVQPRYFKSFQCLGGACKQDCCHNWGQISWTHDEYEKLINADMSEELRSRITGSFEKEEDAHLPGRTIYSLIEVDRHCPIQDSDGLCMIQRELGEEYLSRTCRFYPRVMIECGKYYYRMCHLSCYAVVEMLCSDESAMELDISKYNLNKTESKPKDYFRINEKRIQKRPILQYFNEIFRFFYDIAADKSYPIETALVLGALAAQQFTKLEERNEYNRVPEAIEALKKQLLDKEQIKKIGDIQPNDNYRIALPCELVRETINMNVTIFSKILEVNENVVSVERFQEGRRRLAELFRGREFYRRNLVLDMMLETQMPFFDDKLTIYENWLYLCAFFSEMEFLITGAVFGEKNTECFVKCSVSALGRVFSHINDASQHTVSYLKQKGFTKPAHIALMLKDPI